MTAVVCVLGLRYATAWPWKCYRLALEGYSSALEMLQLDLKNLQLEATAQKFEFLCEATA